MGKGNKIYLAPNRRYLWSGSKFAKVCLILNRDAITDRNDRQVRRNSRKRFLDHNQLFRITVMNMISNSGFVKGDEKSLYCCNCDIFLK